MVRGASSVEVGATCPQRWFGEQARPGIVSLGMVWTGNAS